VGLSPWDVAAGALLVHEAGGIVTDVLGGGAFLETGDILAAGPSLHAEMLRVTRDAFSG
jgi:myo-inositol-1(or 4)-monophosphatase